MEPPTQLAHTATDALSSPTALAVVAAALDRDGIAVLRRESGLTPGELVAFMQRLSVAAGLQCWRRCSASRPTDHWPKSPTG